jgi:hypothetical protein
MSIVGCLSAVDEGDAASFDNRIFWSRFSKKRDKKLYLNKELIGYLSLTSTMNDFNVSQVLADDRRITDYRREVIYQRLSAHLHLSARNASYSVLSIHRP